MTRRPALLLLLLALMLSACAPYGAVGMSVTATQPVIAASATASPTLKATRNPAPSPTPGATSTPAPPVLWISPEVPAGLREGLDLPASVRITEDQNQANLFLYGMDGVAVSSAATTLWVYALAAPFPTISDSIDFDVLRKAWHEGKPVPGWELPLLMTAETQAAMERRLGLPAHGAVRLLDAEALLPTAWEENLLAIIPFEAIEPRWKVMRIGAISPFDPIGDYPLTVRFDLYGADQSVDGIKLPTNRDPEKLTRLVMTGVTALSRRIAEKMESDGLTYPAKDIGSLLAEADLTHISNEVSFYADCPKPGPLRADMRFCSNPRYIKLLEAVGADVIELTGNHNLDWGFEPYLYSLEMYRERGWGVYGGGENLNASRVPLEIAHNGNSFVFLGCSPAGPEAVWATEWTPGSAPCDLDKLERQITALRAEGRLPILTFQHVETLGYVPSPAQGSPDFRRMARAGAVIVSGSQSHYAQTMTLVTGEYGASFVHYGLGNLFFDQMEPEEIRPAFIDRHIFYDGRYLGVELVTTILEEGARPRLMTAVERQEFLTTIFSLSNWESE